MDHQETCCQKVCDKASMCFDDVRRRTSQLSCFHTCLLCSCILPLCLGFALWSAGQGVALCARTLDQFIAPGELPVDSPESFHTRLHNHTTMPQSCTFVVPRDAVENVSVAEECLAWCRASLGPGAGIVFAFSPLHWRYIQQAGFTVQTSFKMCWKVETAAWALGWCPADWQMYLIVSLYGSVSGLSFLHFLKKNVEEDSSSDDSESDNLQRCTAPDDEGFVEGGPFFSTRRYRAPFCCFSISSDYEGAKCQLRLSAFFMLFEPALDILSVLMFLRRGQPIYAAVVGTSVVFSCLLVCDLFQVRGVAAMAQSLGRGFATGDLYCYRVMELVESFGSTLVQCYAALRMDLSWASVSAVCTLLGSAGISLAVSMPDACRAALVLFKTHARNDYYQQERVKAEVNVLQRYWPSVLCMAIAELALVVGRHNDGQLSSPWAVLLAAPASSWDSFLSALLLLGFRIAVLSALVIAVIAFCLGCVFLLLAADFMDEWGG